VLKYQIPGEPMESITLHHCEPDIFQYWYETYDAGELSSSWLLRFFQRRTFVATVTRERPVETQPI
jgi:hypothetical protein